MEETKQKIRAELKGIFERNPKLNKVIDCKEDAPELYSLGILSIDANEFIVIQSGKLEDLTRCNRRFDAGVNPDVGIDELKPECLSELHKQLLIF